MNCKTRVANIYIILALLLTMIGIADAELNCNAIISGNTIYSGTCRNITEINNILNNISALQNLGYGEWLLNANLVINSSIFYINSSDVSWLKINSTGDSIFYLSIINGSTYINDSKITSWNTSKGEVEKRTDARIKRSYMYVDGERANDGRMYANNSNISYLGWSDNNWASTFDEGITITHVEESEIRNSSLINNGALTLRYSNATRLSNNSIEDALIYSINLVDDTDAPSATQRTSYANKKVLNNIINMNMPDTGYAVVFFNEINYTEFKNNKINNSGLSKTILVDRSSNIIMENNEIIVSNTLNSKYAYQVGGSTVNVENITIKGDSAKNYGDSIFLITDNTKNILIEGVNFTSKSVVGQTFTTNKLTLINSKLRSTNGRGLFFVGPSDNFYLYNVSISSENWDGIVIASADARNITLEDVIINSGSGYSVNIIGDTTNKFINTTYASLYSVSDGKLNYYYNTTLNLPYAPFTINLYLNESLNDTHFSNINIIKFPVQKYSRNFTQLWNYVQKFEIDNATPDKYYWIKRNGILSQQVLANASGYLIFYEDINQSLILTIESAIPKIKSYMPSTTLVNSSINEAMTFNLTTDQIVNVSWYIDGIIVQTNNSVNSAWYTNSSSSLGTWNLTAIASNLYGTSSKTWIWKVNNCNAVQNGNTIYIGTCKNMTQVNDSLNNISALQNLGYGEWLLNANLVINSSIFYINSSDVSWLKINSTGDSIFYLSIINGSTFINDSKITSWNTSSNSVEERAHSSISIK